MDSPDFNLDSFLQQYRLPVLFGLFGLIIFGIGALSIKKLFPEESKVEISSSSVQSNPISTQVAQGKIMADVAGAVIRSGVYELDFGSRVNDLLVLAGGLAAEADRDWVAKNINLAQKLTDGAKIYIPSRGEKAKEQETGSSKALGVSEKININTATEKELDTLYGIGPVTAQKIIEGRPYQRLEDLINKKIVKSNVWEKIKEKITVY